MLTMVRPVVPTQESVTTTPEKSLGHDGSEEKENVAANEGRDDAIATTHLDLIRGFVPFLADLPSHLAQLYLATLAGQVASIKEGGRAIVTAGRGYASDWAPLFTDLPAAGLDHIKDIGPFLAELPPSVAELFKSLKLESKDIGPFLKGLAAQAASLAETLKNETIEGGRAVVAAGSEYASECGPFLEDMPASLAELTREVGTEMRE